MFPLAYLTPYIPSFPFLLYNIQIDQFFYICLILTNPVILFSSYICSFSSKPFEFCVKQYDFVSFTYFGSHILICIGSIKRRQF